MVNKLWYKSEEGEDIDNYIKSRHHIQKFLDLYCHGIFEVLEDITPDNLKQFLEIILKQYECYNFSNLMSIGDVFETYFYEAYKDDFPETFFPVYPKSDRRSISMCILNECIIDGLWALLPEEVPLLIKCLNVPDDEIIYVEERLEKYFDQFDFMKRNNIEFSKRWEVIEKQRLEAIEKNQPLPIRPMGIELSLCYKEGFEPKE